MRQGGRLLFADQKNGVDAGGACSMPISPLSPKISFVTSIATLKD